MQSGSWNRLVYNDPGNARPAVCFEEAAILQQPPVVEIRNGDNGNLLFNSKAEGAVLEIPELAVAGDPAFGIKENSVASFDLDPRFHESPVRSHVAGPVHQDVHFPEKDPEQGRFIELLLAHENIVFWNEQVAHHNVKIGRMVGNVNRRLRKLPGRTFPFYADENTGDQQDPAGPEFL